MRLNKYLAAATGMSRRTADAAVASGRVRVNGAVPDPGLQLKLEDVVLLDGNTVTLSDALPTTIMLHKPVGYVVSRDGQGSRSVYELLPPELHKLKPAGRLDKDSSGLLILTDDGQLAEQLTHPRYQKIKQYEVQLDKPLAPLHRQMITDHGVMLEDGRSSFQIVRLHDSNDTDWLVIMREGRNRQIRRTFAALGYKVTRLHRTQFGTYMLGDLRQGAYEKV